VTYADMPIVYYHNDPLFWANSSKNAKKFSMQGAHGEYNEKQIGRVKAHSAKKMHFNLGVVSINDNWLLISISVYNLKELPEKKCWAYMAPENSKPVKPSSHGCDLTCDVMCICDCTCDAMWTTSATVDAISSHDHHRCDKSHQNKSSNHWTF